MLTVPSKPNQQGGGGGGGSGGQQKAPGGVPAWSTFMPGMTPVIGGPARPLPQPGQPITAPAVPLPNLGGGAVPPPPSAMSAVSHLVLVDV
jgi:hypothetical protein